MPKKKMTATNGEKSASSVSKSVGKAKAGYVAVDLSTRTVVASGRTSESARANAIKAGHADAAIDYRTGRRSS